MTPPGLAWLPNFCRSTGGALDQPIVAEVYKTVNALIYSVLIKWHDPVSPYSALLVWNLFQKWANKNSSTPSGRIEYNEAPSPITGKPRIAGFKVEVHLTERLGLPKDAHPET